MIRTPNGKNLMNLQEAVQWLLDNNALPFQCTADYVAGAEIGLGTIVNPTPAKVRVGSLIFFADSKVSTVIALTSNSFICSDEYNDLVDDVVYVSNVALNASGHLIVTLSNGDTIDAGNVKQVSSFSINGSQHLIATYNDGTSTDLGAIFNGNISISGNLTVSGGISGNAITGDSIIENMSGYSFLPGASSNVTYNYVYCGAVKNGNKVTFVTCLTFTLGSAYSALSINLGAFNVPSAIFSKLYPFTFAGSLDLLNYNNTTVLDVNTLQSYDLKEYAQKVGVGSVRTTLNTTGLSLETDYFVRIEHTYLLSENLAA